MAVLHDNCPLCGGAASPRYRPVDAKGVEWRIDRCASCGLGFLNPMLEGEELDPFYSDEYYGPGRHRFSGVAEGFIPLFRKARAMRIKRLMPEGGAILDVGCGRGLMLAELKKQGYRAVGAERSDPAAEAAREAGVEVHAGDVDKIDLPARSFDMVTFWQVLEHLERPLEAVKVVTRALKPGGRILVQVPDLDGFQAKLGGDRWFHLDPPRHLWHFNLKSLDLLLSKAGLKREKLGHLSVEYGPFGMMQSLLKMTGMRRDLFFDLLMSRDPKTLIPSATARAALWAAAAVLGPISFAADLIASALKAGSVIEAVYAEQG